jgi:hypothetical protein
MEDIGFLPRQHAYHYAQLALMSDKQIEDMLSDEREFRRLLVQSLMKKPQQTAK